MEYSELQQSLDSENKKNRRLQEAIEKEMGECMMQWLNTNVLELHLVELQEFQKWLEGVDSGVKEKVNKILVKARQTTQGFVPQPLMETASALWYQFGQHINVDSMASTGPSSINGFIHRSK